MEPEFVEEDLGSQSAAETRGGTHLSDIRVTGRITADPSLGHWPSDDDIISGDLPVARAHTWDDMIFVLAARAYAGYGNDAGWKNYRGEPMPKWHELSPETRRHWCAAMAAVARPLELPDEGSVH